MNKNKRRVQPILSDSFGAAMGSKAAEHLDSSKQWAAPALTTLGGRWGNKACEQQASFSWNIIAFLVSSSGRNRALLTSSSPQIYVSEESNHWNGLGRHCSFQQSHSGAKLRAAGRFWLRVCTHTVFRDTLWEKARRNPVLSSVFRGTPRHFRWGNPLGIGKGIRLNSCTLFSSILGYFSGIQIPGPHL